MEKKKERKKMKKPELCLMFDSMKCSWQILKNKKTENRKIIKNYKFQINKLFMYIISNVVCQY